MINLLKLSLALLLVACSTSSMAQRRYLPLMDLVDVPVSLASAKPMSAEQVRAAIIGAALAAEWDVDANSDGSLTLSAFRDMEYRVTMKASFSDSKYSLVYVSSENLKTSSGEKSEPRPGLESLGTYIENWRKSRGTLQPEFKFAVDRTGIYIHPTYELLVYELSAGIRRHLRVAAMQPVPADKR